jgi:hypothetical protein
MPDPITLPEGPFSGPQAFAQLLRDAMACAAQQGWTRMVWSDADYADWPLREKAVIDALNDWAGAGRSLLMLAQRYDQIPRMHPRFVGWRSTWNHVVECRVCKTWEASEFPSALWSSQWCVQRLESERSTGMSGSEAVRRQRLLETLEECRRQSSPGFPSSTLGL